MPPMNKDQAIKELLYACADELNIECSSVERVLARIALEMIKERDEERAAHAETRRELDGLKTLLAASAPTPEPPTSLTIEMKGNLYESYRSAIAKLQADLAAATHRAEQAEADAAGMREAFRALVSESQGVYGLHRNGDNAPWEELCTGGQFEEWCKAFDDPRYGADLLAELERLWAELKSIQEAKPSHG